MRTNAYDIAVIGGGPSGVPAALQAVQLGARTLLVEKNAGLGGTTTSANVAFPGLFHAWGEQVIAGMGWELVCRAVELSGDALPDFRDDERPHWQRQVRVNAPLYGALRRLRPGGELRAAGPGHGHGHGSGGRCARGDVLGPGDGRHRRTDDRPAPGARTLRGDRARASRASRASRVIVRRGVRCRRPGKSLSKSHCPVVGRAVYDPRKAGS